MKNFGAGRTSKPEDSAVAAARELLNDCHLVDDTSVWPQRSSGRLYSDDDLSVFAARCECGRHFIHVFRRVRGGGWDFLIPASETTLDEFATIANESLSYSDGWRRAEEAVVSLTSRSVFIERTSSPPAVCRWSEPGKPLAFNFPPS